MATEEQANLARKAHADLLVQRGAHAIGVDEGASFGKPGFVVVAYVAPNEDHDIPAHLTCASGNYAFEVPVVTKTAPRFKLG
jgi:hypothetical protein